MATVTLGKTGLTVNKNGFGALPIQRISTAEAGRLLRRAYDHGVDFFDTARSYSDSEEKIGAALSGVRDRIIIATKTPSVTTEGFWADLHKSLELLKTDYVDILQFHNPGFCPQPGDGTGLYEAALEAQQQGKVRFIGLTNHRIDVAREGVQSGLYDTLQFPFSYLASEEEVQLVKECEEANVGFIAMKGMSGGLISNSRAAYAFMSQYDSVEPIWGVQRESELDEFLSYGVNPPEMDEATAAYINEEKEKLKGNFCRGCGYCLPCPAEINIPFAARMSLLLRRAPAAGFLTAEWQEKMARIDQCVDCGHCRNHCPYFLDTPALLRENYKDYKTFL